MPQYDGRKRVIITNIVPLVDGGAYPAKTAEGETITISADIFCDGHDEIVATISLKHKNDRQWKEYPLNFINNDHWEYVFQPAKTGIYQFRIQAWIDHFTTWKNGLQKKYEAGLDISVDLLIGAEMLRAASLSANAKDKKLLASWAKDLAAPGNEDAMVAIITGDKVSETVHRQIARDNVTISGTYTIEVERKKAAFSTWYELFPRSAAERAGEHGTFKDVKKLLPHIADMGFDVVYFPPIHPIGHSKRKGKNNSLLAEPSDPGSPWAIGNKKGGHKAIHPQLGTLKDFKSLIAEAQKYDIEIALDIAYQCSPDHPYVKEHPQWFKWRPDGTVQFAENPPKKYEDILPINFETDDWQNLWKELKSIVDYWIAAGIKIFRVDNPHTKAFPFWEWMIAEVRKQHLDVIFLAEAFTRPRLMERLAKAGFNQSYTYFTWRNTKQELEEYMTELTKTDMRYYFRPNFWPNTPDILPPVLTEGGENAHIMRLILAATLSSNYGLYGPVYEYGINKPRPGKEEYIDNEKYEIRHWNWQQYTRIKEFIARINRIRKENTALQTTWNIEFARTTNDNIICFTKTDVQRNNVLIVAVNLDPHHTQSAIVDLPIKKLGIKEGIPYTVTDLLSGDEYEWQGATNYVELNPFDIPAHVLRVEQQNKEE